ncbi:MAG TPA: MipA/OmpV family protein [Macromonas sp.]|nr:MipA/OmpV family protein [Macromonas sp.]
MKTVAHFSRVVAGVVCLCAAWAHAQETPEPPQAPVPAEVALDAPRDYLLGLSVNSSLDPLGGDGREQSWRPLWAFQWGRFRFATGGAAALLSLGRQRVDSGVSTSLLEDDRWSVSGSLSWDGGREADAPLLQGLPDVRSTLRGRMNLGYQLSPRWSVGVTASQDLLGREGGLRLNTGLKYHHPVSGRTYWDLGLGAQWGNGTFMQTHYGITPTAAQSAGRDAYAVSSGWESVGVNWGMASALNERWVMFGGVRWSGLNGAARRSPLVANPDTWGASLGLAYRCCN